MRLLRVEVDRYGALQGEGLGDIGRDLTVVFGPNEAGKSTYTTLVRHVLYGYPTAASKKDAPYLSEAGKRSARLVFLDDDGGEWSIERTEGPHGGPVAVRAPDGSRSDGLVADLTRGVSDTAYRIVFGFGLDEMAQIEHMRGSEDDIIGRLYAASAGLAVSPMDVRSAIEGEAREIFAPRATKPRINALTAELRGVRESIRESERVSEGYRDDRDRLAALDERLAEASLARANAHDRLASFRVAMERIEKADRTIDEGEKELKELRLSERDLRAASEVMVDEAALTAGPAIDGILDDLSAFKQWTEDRARQAGTVSNTGADIEAIAVEAGVDTKTLVGLRVDGHVRSELDKREDALRRAEVQRAAARELAAGSAAGERVGVGGSRGSVAPGIVLLLVAVAAAAAGFILGGVALPLGVGIGLVVGALGIWTLLAARSGTGGGSGGHSREDAVALARADQAYLDAEVAWADALSSLDLPEGAPSQTRRLVDAVERARAADDRGREAEAELVRLDASIDSYQRRLFDVARAFAGEGPAEIEKVAEYAAMARSMVAAAREAAVAKEQANAELRSIEHRIEGVSETVQAAREEALETYRGLALDSGGSVEVLRHAAEDAGAVAVEAERAYDALAEERSRLAERLDAAARENPAAELRLREATLEEEIAQAAQRYAVLAVAAELLTRAQERYERERQPEVVKAAQGFLGSITGGRYVSLRIPLGEDGIEVVDASGKARRSALLSRGTVEQMYLALRLGLVSRMGEAGADLPLLMDDVFVNFDPERARGAAQAVSELALTRQVVLFTCHPATLALLEEVAQPTVIRLDRC